MGSGLAITHSKKGKLEEKTEVQENPLFIARRALQCVIARPDPLLLILQWNVAMMSGTAAAFFATQETQRTAENATGFPGLDNILHIGYL